jgi:hypothetical protein
MTSHLLKFNEDKTVVLTLSSRFREGPDFQYLKVGNENVTTSSTAKNIGVVFDSGFAFEKQVNNIVRKAWTSLWKIGKIRKYLTRDGTEILMHAFVTSRIDYCNSLLTSLPHALIHKIQLVQNAAARVVTQTRKFDHISPVLYDLHWLPVVHRIHYKVLLMVFKALSGLAPQYLADMIELQPHTRLRSTSNDSRKLKEVRSRMVNYGDRAFSIAAPRMWNQLPVNIRHMTSLELFKAKLKTHLFSIAFDHMDSSGSG